MHELLRAFPELPLLVLVAVVAVLSPSVRRYVIGMVLGLVAAIVLGVLAHQALTPDIGWCRAGGAVRALPGPATAPEGGVSRSAR